MKFCFGTVCWDGYLERYIDIFINNYITMYRKLVGLGVDYNEIANPKIVYCNDTPGEITKYARDRLFNATGKSLELIFDRHKWSVQQIMYSTRNRLRTEFKKSYPLDKKVFFYFPIDDNVRSEIVFELMRLKNAKKPTACMFKFYVNQGGNDFTAGTRAITSYQDIHPEDWGGYCAYNILNEEECPLYPEIDIPNVAFYAELYRVGYYEYESENICIDHLRHGDSHHFKHKNTDMTTRVKDFLLAQRIDLFEKGYK